MVKTDSLTIDKIQALTLAEVKELTEEKPVVIKGHEVYFADLGETFGYSALVFYEDRHIYYANEYQLHYRHRPEDTLRDHYISILGDKLFTEEELVGAISSHDEYSRKAFFLHNYYGMREDYVSFFRIASTEAEEAAYEASISGRIFNPVCLGYYLPEKQGFVDHCVELQKALNKARDAMLDDYEYQKKAFLSEMFNHEYGYSGSPDYDVLQVFGNIHYKGDDETALQAYFRELGFSEIRERAYRAAQREYWETANL